MIAVFEMLTTRLSDAEAALFEAAADAAMPSVARAWLRFFRRLGWECRVAAKTPASGCCALEVRTSTDPGRWLPVFVDPMAASYFELRATCMELLRFGDIGDADDTPFAVVGEQPIFPSNKLRNEEINWDYMACFHADGIADDRIGCGAWQYHPPCLGVMRFLGVDKPWFLVLAPGDPPVWAGVFTGSDKCPKCPTDDPGCKPLGYIGVRDANWTHAARRMWRSL
jgi:hypothetical protein